MKTFKEKFKEKQLHNLNEELARLEFRADHYSRTDWEIYQLLKAQIWVVNQQILELMTEEMAG